MLKLTIETENEAFQEDVRGEIARIFKSLASDIRNGKEPSKVYDYNGNSCGVVIWAV